MLAGGQRGPKVGDLTKTTDIVKLISAPNEEGVQKSFFLNRDVACQSELLREQLATAPRLGNTATRVINLEMPAHTIETVVKYLHYRIINAKIAQSERAGFDIDPNEALNILNAAIYLRC